MRVVVAILIILIIIGAVILGYLVGIVQKPIPLPAQLPSVQLPQILQQGKELQGYWKLEQFLLEDEAGNLKLIRSSVPGATDNYFSFEGEHVCTDGQLDINNKPLPCYNYTTYTIDGNSISIDQAGKPPAKGTWTIINDMLEINVLDENQKNGKFILRRLSQ